MGGLRLRPLHYEDEAVARAAHVELSDEDFPFLLFFEAQDPWVSYVDAWRAGGLGHAVPHGPAVPSTFLIAVANSEIVGRVSVRFALNEWLAHEGGHIGYAVRPQFRRRGYARQMLAQALVVARAHDVETVLMVCDEANPASARVIEGAGGVFEGHVRAQDGVLLRRYWIH